MVTFRKFSKSDFIQLFEWLQEPHVKEWWDDGDNTIEKVIKHYSSEANKVYRYILLSNDKKPIGYFQYYLKSKELVGIDQFIGYKSFLNKGVGTEAIKLFIDIIISDLNPSSIIIDPEPTNCRAIRCYEKVGFKFSEITSGQDGKEAYIMRYDIINN